MTQSPDEVHSCYCFAAYLDRNFADSPEVGDGHSGTRQGGSCFVLSLKAGGLAHLPAIEIATTSFFVSSSQAGTSYLFPSSPGAGRRLHHPFPGEGFPSQTSGSAEALNRADTGG